jgi:hypothetical protein
MTRINFRLSLAAALVAGTAIAAEPVTPSRIDTSIYDQYAQAETGSGLPPVQAAVPQEDAYQLRALPPGEAAQEASVEEGPDRYLETEFLKSRGINTYGWIAAGIGANNWASPFNGPITFNDRNWQGQMNQLYLVNEKLVDTSEGLDWGGRVDLLYGTDYIYTTARGWDGFLANQGSGVYGPGAVAGSPSWASSKDYGLAIPQMYAELGYGNHVVRAGHFYTIIGYEVVPAIGNFFYTHAYTMQYGEPFTHTGILDTWTPNDQVTVYAGITNGWDNFADPINSQGIGNPLSINSNSNAAFLGGVSFKNSDQTQAFTSTVSSGNEPVAFLGANTFPNVGNRSVWSNVYTNELNDKWTYVFQNDNGWQFNAITDPAYQTLNQQAGLAQWYGINQYLFYNVSDTLVAGMRFEWFRDNNGYRVFAPIRNGWVGGPALGGFKGNFFQATWGLNWKPTRNFMVRPEVRYDWYSPDDMETARAGGALPFGPTFGTVNGPGGDKYGQLYGGCDAIWQF